MKHKTVESENGVTHYWIAKNNNINSKNIVFCHGLCSSHIMFEKQTEYFSKNHTVIIWDIPMHGESRPYLKFSFKNTAIELKSILDAEKINKAVLVGMSMGGYPCQEFADRYPQMVLGFVALDTTPYGLIYYSKTDKWLLSHVEKTANLFGDKMLRKSMAKSVSKTKYSYDMMIKMLKPLSKKEICRQMGIAYCEFLKENRDVKFDFPVLILLGEYDKSGKIKKYCREWSEKQGYPLHIIPGAAHFSNGDNPEKVNSEIEQFISDIK